MAVGGDAVTDGAHPIGVPQPGAVPAFSPRQIGAVDPAHGRIVHDLVAGQIAAVAGQAAADDRDVAAARDRLGGGGKGDFRDRHVEMPVQLVRGHREEGGETDDQDQRQGAEETKQEAHGEKGARIGWSRG